MFRKTLACKSVKAVAVPADGAHPDRAVVAIRAADHIRLEPRQFLGMQPRIHKQP